MWGRVRRSRERGGCGVLTSAVLCLVRRGGRNEGGATGWCDLSEVCSVRDDRIDLACSRRFSRLLGGTGRKDENENDDRHHRDHRDHRRRLRVAIAISGGVDSAVAAALLTSGRVASFPPASTDFVGVFMRNWDAAEEDEGRARASSWCAQASRDFRDAQRVCDRLQIPLVQLDFVSSYYTEVFEPFLEGLRRGGRRIRMWIAIGW